MNKITLEIVNNSKRQFQEIDVRSYVKKPLESFIYKETIKDTRIPLTYVHCKKIYSDSNLKINDLTSSNNRNSNYTGAKEEKYFFINGSSINTEYNSIKVTNILHLNSNNVEVPLFYVHRLDSAVEANIEIKTNMSEEYDEVYKIDIANNSVYHNYLNYFDEKSGKYRLFYVNWIDVNGNSYRELLDSADVVYELTWEDIDPFTGQVKAGVFGYEKVENAGNYSYFLNNPGEYYWFPLSENCIKCKAPKGRSSKEPWYLEVENGNFSKTYENYLYRYRVNEYYNQYFTPSFPYSFIVYFELDWVNKNTLKSDTDSIFYSKEKNLNVEVFVYSEDNVLIRALSTDKTKNNQRFEKSDVFWETEIISSVDEEKGFIELKEDFNPAYTYKGSFFYKKKNFQYSRLNLNPIYNKDILTCYYVFYCIPNLYDYETSIHYLKVNKYGTIEYCSQGDGSASERANYPCLSVKDESGKVNSSTVVGGSYKGENGFIANYSSEGNNEFRYQILGEISFQETTNIDEMFHFEFQEKGGKIKDEEKAKVLRRNTKLIQSKLGYSHDGIRYSKSNCHYIEVPMNLLEKYGGVFSEENVTEIINNKMPSFSKNILKWIYPKGKFEITNSEESKLHFKFDFCGKGKQYILYKKAKKEEAYIYCKTIESILGGSSFTDEDVASKSIYYYAVAIKEKGYEYPLHNYREVYVR